MAITKAIKKFPNEEQLTYNRYEGYFGICFAQTKYVEHSCYKRDFSRMEIDEAVEYSRQLIKDTIDKMKEIGEEVSVDYSIDTVIIKPHSILWDRERKNSYTI